MRDQELVYSIKEGAEEDTVIVQLDGPLTLSNMFTFQSDLRNVDSPFTVFDLTNSEYMDSARLGILINFYVSAEKNGRKISLAGVNDRVGALLDLTHVRSLLRVYATVEEALASR